jgi:hypothetical protein
MASKNAFDPVVFNRKEIQMAKVTGLSGNEIYCLALKNYTTGELVVGNSVNSMGFLGGMAAGFKGMAGGECLQSLHQG